MSIKGFIEVIDLQCKTRYLFNIDHIINVADQGDHACLTTTRFDEHKLYTVQEDYAMVMGLIRKARNE